MGPASIVRLIVGTALGIIAVAVLFAMVAMGASITLAVNVAVGCILVIWVVLTALSYLAR